MSRRSLASAALFAGASLITAHPASAAGLTGQMHGFLATALGDHGRFVRTTTYRHRVEERGKPGNELKLAERRGFKRVSDLTNFPRFFPGLGIVTVKPATLPMGPFLSFDRRDHLMSTTYMIPLAEMDEHKRFELTGLSKRADHTTVYYNGGHPGVTMPHYHFVVWHVTKAEEARVAR